jgi:DNA-binding XRE family transcriptional regulator
MKQPQLGQKIQEMRVLKGLTQKDLSDACHVDIRTIQRIESGEVIPRMSTLKLIAQSLGWDMIPPLPEPARTDKPDDSGMLLPMLIVSFIAGMVFVVNWLFYAQVIPPNFLSF